jgi:hypothetical protein
MLAAAEAFPSIFSLSLSYSFSPRCNPTDGCCCCKHHHQKQAFHKSKWWKGCAFLAAVHGRNHLIRIIMKLWRQEEEEERNRVPARQN